MRVSEFASLHVIRFDIATYVNIYADWKVLSLGGSAVNTFHDSVAQATHFAFAIQEYTYMYAYMRMDIEKKTTLLQLYFHLFLLNFTGRVHTMQIK